MGHSDRYDRIRSVVVSCVVVLAVLGAGLGVWAFNRHARLPRIITADCPAVMPGTNNANEDFADMFVWQARTYISSDTGVQPAAPLPDPIQRGRRVGQITCSLTDPPMSTVRERIANLPWPDGTATGLPNGTTIYAVRGITTGCALTAERDGGLVSYVAIDTRDNSWPAFC